MGPTLSILIGKAALKAHMQCLFLTFSSSAELLIRNQGWKFNNPTKTMQYWLWKLLCLGLPSWCGSVNVWRLTAVLVTRITHNRHRNSTQTNTHSPHRGGVCQHWGDLCLFSLSLLMTLFILFFGSPALDKESIKCSCVSEISEKKLWEQTNYVTA